MRGRLRAGDPDAFRDLFDECARAVYNHGFRLSGNWSTAEDIVALTFLEAWRLRARLETTGGSVKPWLLGIATNVARNTARAARRHAAAVAQMSPAGFLPDFADDLVDRIDDARQLAAVGDILRTLRPAERDVFALCVWAGLDYASAALALGVAVGTVRSRLSRARRKVQKALNGKGTGAREPDAARGQQPGDRDTAVGTTGR